MTTILLKALMFVLIICLGYFLKRNGFFRADDYRVISKIVLNITLPAAVISGFADFAMDISLLVVVALGLACNIIMVLLGFLGGASSGERAQAFYMLNLSGYNIGCFTMPFVQSFLGPFGVVTACMFDSGNSIMCTGGTYAAAANVVGSRDEGVGFTLVKKLFSSIPFDVYLLMLILSILDIHFPSTINSFFAIIAGANSFLAMLMIGMMVEFDLEWQYLRQAAVTLTVRYVISALFAAIFYFVLPLSLEIRQVLVLVVFAPISALVPVFTEKCQGNAALSSLTNSVSIFISMIIITVLLLVMNIQ